MATFTKSGTYNFQVTITDSGGLAVTGILNGVVVNQTYTSVAVTPANASVNLNGVQQFSATANDQFGIALATQPTFTWTVSGGGTIDQTGKFTAGGTPGGPFTLTATGNGKSGTASVTVVNAAPTITTAAAATPNTVTGTNTALTVSAADDGGAGNLTYSWQTTGTPPAAVTFSANGTNAAHNTTATFAASGTYSFKVTVTDAQGATATSTIPAVTVNQTTTSISVTPANVSVNINATQQFTASAADQFGHVMNTQPTFAWSVDGGGTISTSGLLTAAATTGGPFTVTAAADGKSGTATFTVVDSAPTVAQAASANPNPVTGNTTALSVLGADDSGEANLSYSWAAVSNPPAPVTFNPNGTHDAKNATATFSKAGVYTLQVTIADAGGLTATSQVQVTVNQTYSSVSVQPANATVNLNGTQQFNAIANDQFGNALANQPASYVWAITGGGTIDQTGLFTAGTVAGGPFDVTATNSGKTGTANVTIIDAAPTIRTAASAIPNPTTTTTTNLSVLGQDDGGEGALSYTWTTTGTPPAAVTFSANASNAAKNTTATFTKAGNYNLQATVTDGSGQTATSSVTVTVNQTLSIVVTPANATVALNGTRAFTALMRDQFGQLPTQPTFAWAVTGGGTIDQNGTFTAGTTPGGPFVVSATANAVTGTADVTVVNTAPTIVTAASATPNPTVSTSTQLSVAATDDAGEPSLTYTWATTGTPPAAVSFSSNGTNASKTTTANFIKNGSYDFQVTVADSGGLTTTSAVTVVVNQNPSISVTPANASVNLNGSQQFSAVMNDQFGPLANQPTFTWAATGGGTIDQTGKFSAGNVAGGPFNVTATSGTVVGTASITIVDAAPTVAVAAAATPNPTTATQTILTVLGSDDGGEASLQYTWLLIGTPPAGVTFSDNGTNSAKTSVATFSKSGSYDFRVTIQDTAGQTVVSTVTVAVNSTVTSIAVTPANATISLNGTQRFTAIAVDQFGSALATQPTFSWSVTSGTVDNTGLVTAGNTIGGPFVVRASSGTVSGTASFQTTAPFFITPPANLTVAATDGNGAIVNFPAATVVDSADPNPTVVYSRYSGTQFPIGTTTVNIVATDINGSVALAHFNVSVAPLFIVPPADVKVAATSVNGAVVTYLPAIVTDVVDPAPVIHYSQASGSQFALGNTVVSINASDAAGNSATASFNVFVNPLSIAQPADVTVSATGPDGAVVSYPAATVTDYVDNSPVVTYSQSSGTLFTMGTTLVTVNASDAAGNIAVVTFNVTVNSPLTITPPADVTVQATGGNGATVNYAAATVVDPLDPAPIITYSQNSGTTFPVGTTTVIVTATDAFGFVATGSFNVTVTSPIVITPHSDIVVQSTGNNSAIVSYAASTVVDPLDPHPTITYSKASGTSFPVGTTTVTVTATDVHLNTGTAFFNVTVTSPLMITAPADLVTQATGATGAIVTYSPATATDAVDPSPVILYSKNSGTLFALGTTSVTVTATDAHGNSATAAFNVTVNALSLTPPADVVVQATSANSALVNYAAATATDVIDPSPAVTYSQNSGSVFPLGTTAVTVTATDLAGNTATAFFNVTVTSPIVVTPPADVIVNATSANGATVSLPAATVTDPLDQNPALSYSPSSGSTFTVGTTVVTVIAKDSAGNEATAFFNVTVLSPLTITQPDDVVYQATAPTGAVAYYPSATVTDPIDPTPVITYSQASNTLFPIGNTVVQISARDSAGNFASVSFIVTVEPVLILTPPDDITIQATGPTGAIVNYSAAIFSDVIDPFPVITYSQPSGTLFPIGTTPVTVTATDNAGNTATGSFNVTVTSPLHIFPNNDMFVTATSPAGAVVYFPLYYIDFVTPTFTFTPPNGSLLPIGTTSVTISAVDSTGSSDSITFNVTVTSPISITPPADITVAATSANGAVVNYGPAHVVDPNSNAPQVSYSTNSGSTFPIGSNTVTISVSDAAGYNASTTFNVRVVPLLITPPANVIATASGNSALVTYPPASVTGYLQNTVTYSQASGTSFPIGTTAVTVTAADTGGNSATATFIVTVVSPLTISVQDNVTEATRPDGAIVNYPPAIIVDSADAAPIITYSQPSGTVFPLGVTRVIVSVTDSFGNSESRSFTVTVQDTTPPTVIAPDIFVDTDNTDGTSVVNGQTVYGQFVDLTSYVTVTDAVTAHPAVVFNQESAHVFPLWYSFANVVVIDDAGNVTAKWFAIYVNNHTVSVFLPEDIIVQATSPAGAVVHYPPPPAVDETSVVYKLSNGTYVPDGSTFPIGTTLVYIYAYDANGNYSWWWFRVIVLGNDPAIEQPVTAQFLYADTNNGIVVYQVNVLGSDPGGEENLTYTWETTQHSHRTLLLHDMDFDDNYDNSAKNTFLYVYNEGTFTIEAIVQNPQGDAATSSLTITPPEFPTNILMDPTDVVLNPGQSVQFSARLINNFYNPMSVQPNFSWSVTGGGVISNNGLFTAGTTGESQGTFIVTASAPGASVSHTFTVTDTSLNVSIVSPTTGTILQGTQNIQIHATASNDSNTVAKIEFFNHDRKIGEVSTPPYNFTWVDVPPGNYTLTAKATDTIGVSKTSDPVTLKILYFVTNISDDPLHYDAISMTRSGSIFVTGNRFSANQPNASATPDSPTPTPNSYLWKKGVLTPVAVPISPLGIGTYNWFFDSANDSGEMIGVLRMQHETPVPGGYLAGPVNIFGFTAKDGAYNTLVSPEPGNADPLNINSTGTVVGDDGGYGYIWNGGATRLDLGLPWINTFGQNGHPPGSLEIPTFSEAFAVNDSNQVVGRVVSINVEDQGAVSHAVIWDGNILTDLHELLPGQDSSVAISINNNGTVLGVSTFYNSAFIPINTTMLWQKDRYGKWKAVPVEDTRGANNGFATGAIQINNVGDIIYSGPSVRLCCNDTIDDLNSLIPTGANITLIEHFFGQDTPVGIDDNGNILTRAYTIPGDDFHGHMVLLQPKLDRNIQVHILTPKDVDTFDDPSRIVITADALTTAGTISKVEFFDNDFMKLGESTTAPYTAELCSPSAGQHILKARATSSTGEVRSACVTITVLDHVPPTIVPPPDMLVEATGPGGAFVSWPNAIVTDNLPGSTKVTYSPYRGGLFPLGTTPVTITATDSSGNVSTATFNVVVQDTTPPTITVPTVSAVPGTSGAGAQVFFSNPTAVDIVDGNVSSKVQLSIGSGSVFPYGGTAVVAQVTDSHGNTGYANFTVTVTGTPPQPPPGHVAPVIALSAPSNNEVFNKSNVTFTGTVVDDMGPNLVRVDILANGAVVGSAQALADGTFSVVATMPGGHPSVYARGTESGTNLTGQTSQVQIWVDTQAPKDVIVDAIGSSAASIPNVFTSPGWITGTVRDPSANATGVASMSVGRATDSLTSGFVASSGNGSFTWSAPITFAATNGVIKSGPPWSAAMYQATDEAGNVGTGTAGNVSWAPIILQPGDNGKIAIQKGDEILIGVDPTSATWVKEADGTADNDTDCDTSTLTTATGSGTGAGAVLRNKTDYSRLKYDNVGNGLAIEVALVDENGAALRKDGATDDGKDFWASVDVFDVSLTAADGTKHVTALVDTSNTQNTSNTSLAKLVVHPVSNGTGTVTGSVTVTVYAPGATNGFGNAEIWANPDAQGNLTAFPGGISVAAASIPAAGLTIYLQSTSASPGQTPDVAVVEEYDPGAGYVVKKICRDIVNVGSSSIQMQWVDATGQQVEITQVLTSDDQAPYTQDPGQPGGVGGFGGPHPDTGFHNFQDPFSINNVTLENGRVVCDMVSNVSTVPTNGLTNTNRFVLKQQANGSSAFAASNGVLGVMLNSTPKGTTGAPRAFVAQVLNPIFGFKGLRTFYETGVGTNTYKTRSAQIVVTMPSLPSTNSTMTINAALTTDVPGPTGATTTGIVPLNETGYGTNIFSNGDGSFSITINRITAKGNTAPNDFTATVVSNLLNVNQMIDAVETGNGTLEFRTDRLHNDNQAPIVAGNVGVLLGKTYRVIIKGVLPPNRPPVGPPGPGQVIEAVVRDFSTKHDTIQTGFTVDADGFVEWTRNGTEWFQLVETTTGTIGFSGLPNAGSFDNVVIQAKPGDDVIVRLASTPGINATITLVKVEFVLPATPNTFGIGRADPATDFVEVGLWDHAFLPNNSGTGTMGAGWDLRNLPTEAGNFIGQDSKRFYFRVTNPKAVKNPAIIEDISSATFSWYTDTVVNGVDVIDDKPAISGLTLRETAPGSGVFVSRAVMLVTDDSDNLVATDTGYRGAGIISPAGYGSADHRLRKISSLDDKVVASYYLNGMNKAPVQVSADIFRRNPEFRKDVKIQIYAVFPIGARLWQQISVMRNAYARIGLNVVTVVDPTVTTITNGVDKVAVIPVPTGVTIAAVSDEQYYTLVAAVPPVSVPTARAFVVGGLNTANQAQTFAPVKATGNARVGCTFIEAGSNLFTFAHEITHSVGNKSIDDHEAHYWQPGGAPLVNFSLANDEFSVFHLMNVGASSSDTAGSTKRIWDAPDFDGLNWYQNMRNSQYTSPYTKGQ
jgi:hypothetical protein